MSAPTVHILATCRDEAGLNAAALVFQTLRVGFPTAKVEVTLNMPSGPAVEKAITDAAMARGCTMMWKLRRWSHAEWISELMAVLKHPFWICDTDVVFWESVEDLVPENEAPLFGRYQPEFNDPATGCETMPRLHTSLLRIDPVQFRASVEAYEKRIRLKRFAPPADYWAPIVIPGYEQPRFYDCAAMAYHAIGGESFTDDQNARFDHLHNATYLDEIAPLLPGVDLRGAHAQIYQNPRLLRGAHRQQMQWFAQHR